MHRLLLPLLLSFCTIASAQDAPVPASEATAKFRMPPGFRATLFAGEPDVVQPIAFTFDDRGRIWVVECFTYPNWDGERFDRVLILEDTDGDGKHDKRTVFLDNVKNISGIEYGFGGIWLTAVPNLLFVPDANQDDKPDGPAVVKLDGWDLKAKHNVVNGLAWAPDGWLWGLNGILSNSSVGKPGTPDHERMKMNCGVWRYHPVTDKVESVAHGTTNPWGLDFDEYGEGFITNCVIKHAFHVIPGAHFDRMFGQDHLPFSYQLMPSIADHIHWGGGHWTESRSGAAHDAPGGGHAHSGGMVYLGDNWPKEYRSRLYTCNIHGNRVNQDKLVPHGSSYLAKHEPDVLMANDPWFRGVAIKYGPDGGVYVADWSDTGECHNYVIADRSNGRIFKVTYGDVNPAAKIDLASEDSLLTAITDGKPGWLLQHALRILNERHAAKKVSAEFGKKLLDQYASSRNAAVRLNCVWALNILGAIGPEVRVRMLADPSEHVVAWAIRTFQPAKEPETSPIAQAMCRLASSSESAKVQMALASIAQRYPEMAMPLTTRLAARKEAAQDHYLPQMIWFAIDIDIDRHKDLFSTQLPLMQIPLVRECIARRLTEPSEQESPKFLGQLLDLVVAQAKNEELTRDIARGVFASLNGQRNVKMPESWNAAYSVLSKSNDSQVRDIAVKLDLVFGGSQAVADLMALIDDQSQASDRRIEAVAALAQGKVAKLSPKLIELLGDKALQTTALRYLPTFADAKTPDVLLVKFESFPVDVRSEAIGTLTSRSDWASRLLDAVEAKKIAHRDFTAYHLQQLALLKDKSILDRVEKIFGSVRPTASDKTDAMAKWKERLSPEALAKADTKHGRAMFNKTCAACHKLFDEGGRIGPELTGAQRTNIDYVLSNVLDPSAVVPRDYQMQVVETKDGRVLLGIVKEETDAVLTLQTSTTLVKLAKSDIESREATKQSMMPDGLIQQFSFEEFRDLVGYLASPGQVE